MANNLIFMRFIRAAMCRLPRLMHSMTSII